MSARLGSGLFGALALVLAGVSSASAQTWPARLVKIVVPQAAGGTTDVLARAMGERLAKKWGQPVVIENVAGAAGNVGTGNVAKSAPDGHTLLVTYEGSQAINPHLYPATGFDTVKSFQPIATFARAGFYVIAGPKLPVSDFRDFIAKAKASPTSFNYATSGVGSVNHIIGEMIKTEADIRMVHVAYRGISQAITDISAGHVEAGVAAVPSVIGQVQGGQIRALAVTSAERTAVTPDVPTLKESGLPNIDVNPWWGMLGPAGLDPALVRKINADVNEILADPEIAAFMRKIGAEPYRTGPDEFLEILRRNVATWGEIVRKTGAKPE